MFFCGPRGKEDRLDRLIHAESGSTLVTMDANEYRGQTKGSDFKSRTPTFNPCRYVGIKDDYLLVPNSDCIWFQEE